MLALCSDEKTRFSSDSLEVTIAACYSDVHFSFGL